MRPHEDVPVYLCREMVDMRKSTGLKDQPELINQREQLRAEYVHVKLILATIVYEKARIVKDRQSTFRKLLQEAADASKTLRSCHSSDSSESVRSHKYSEVFRHVVAK